MNRLALTSGTNLISSTIDVLGLSSEFTLAVSGGSQVVTISLATTGVVAGTYSAVSVDTKGRVLTGLNLTATGDATGTAVGSSIALTLAAIGTAGTYSNLVVDTKGRVTSIRAINLTDITTGLGYTPVNNASLAVANGVATLDSNGDLTPAQFPTTTLTGDLTATTTSSTIVTSLSSIITAGTYSTVVIDAKGRVHNGSNVNSHYLYGTIGVTSTTTVFSPANAVPTQSALTSLWSQAITPSSATARIKIHMTCYVDTNINNTSTFSSSGGAAITFAIFRGTYCIGVTVQKVLTATSPESVAITLFDSPATTASTTYSCYYAGSATGTAYINQASGATLGNVGASNAYYVLDIGG